MEMYVNSRGVGYREGEAPGDPTKTELDSRNIAHLEAGDNTPTGVHSGNTARQEARLPQMAGTPQQVISEQREPDDRRTNSGEKKAGAMEMYVGSHGAGETITEDTPTDRVIAWTLERFANQRMVMSTSFGMEGCALIDMYARHQVPITVVYLDTMFFFRETYELRDRLIERYPHMKFVNRGTTLTPEEQAIRFGPELWKRNPDLCCKLRKVDPMYDAMAEADVWITALRRSQSVTRQNLRLIEWDWRYEVLKVSPLFKWERSAIWEYIQRHEVPYNKLHEQGYPTVGCTHCTTPVAGSTLGEYSRAGRWANMEKTECGLHGGAGI